MRSPSTHSIHFFVVRLTKSFLVFTGTTENTRGAHQAPRRRRTTITAGLEQPRNTNVVYVKYYCLRLD